MVLNEKTQPIEIPFNITMGGAGTFTQDEIALPSNINAGVVFDLDKIEIGGLGQLDPTAAGQVTGLFQVTKSSQSAIIGFHETDVIARRDVRAHGSAATLHSSAIIEDLHMDTRGRANLIPRNSVFLGVDTDNNDIVITIRGVLIGSLVKISGAALQQLVLSELV